MKPLNKPYSSAAELERIIDLAQRSPRLRAAADFVKFLRGSTYIGLDTTRMKRRTFVVFQRRDPVPDNIRRYPFVVDTSFDMDGAFIYDVLFDVNDFSKIMRNLFGV